MRLRGFRCRPRLTSAPTWRPPHTGFSAYASGVQSARREPIPSAARAAAPPPRAPRTAHARVGAFHRLATASAGAEASGKAGLALARHLRRHALQFNNAVFRPGFRAKPWPHLIGCTAVTRIAAHLRSEESGPIRPPNSRLSL